MSAKFFAEQWDCPACGFRQPNSKPPRIKYNELCEIRCERCLTPFKVKYEVETTEYIHFENYDRGLLARNKEFEEKFLRGEIR